MSKDYDIGELAREHGPRALDVLADTMESAVEDRDRIRAAEALLDRGYGKASQAIIAVPASRRQAQLLASMSDDQLVAVIEQKQLPRLAPAQSMVTIEPDQATLVAGLHQIGRETKRAIARNAPFNEHSAHGPAADAYSDEPDPLLL